ncbi:fumarase fum1 [Mayamaea pseudoterrestris]|nr:fumarase fum1 [Mayamaea pseudoterrestris]
MPSTMMLSRLMSRNGVLHRAKCCIVQSNRLLSSTSEYQYSPLFESDIHSDASIPYKQLAGPEAVESIPLPNGQSLLQIKPSYLTMLSKQAFSDIAHLLRPAHLRQLSNILNDNEASANDKFVALQLLQNANIASGRILPGCQDTGTAMILAKRGHLVLSLDGNDESHLARGAMEAYRDLNLRYSQVAAIDMMNERNTGNNMPAQLDVMASRGSEYKFLFIAKGGGSANKTFLFQQVNDLYTLSLSLLRDQLYCKAGRKNDQ